MLCSCVQYLPLSDRAVLARRVEVANQTAREEYAQRLEREGAKQRLIAQIRDALGEHVSSLGADWIDYRPHQKLFGPVAVGDLRFGLLMWDEAPQGDLVLLLEDNRIGPTVRDLETLGAYLIERNVVDHDQEESVILCRGWRDHEEDPQPLPATSFRAPLPPGRTRERMMVGGMTDATFENLRGEAEARAEGVVL
jgi:hypothetical protein